MRIVLVTGVNGYVGRNVTMALLGAGYHVMGVSLESSCKLAHAKLEYQQVDILDKSAIDRLFLRTSFDALVHLAALVHARSSLYGFSEYNQVNHKASSRLFQNAQMHRVPRVLFASTVEVYGATPRGQNINEDTPCKPESDYARSKLLAEESLVDISSESSIDHAIMRFAPVYGRDFRLNLDKRLYLRPPWVGYKISRGDYRIGLCSIHNIEEFILRWLNSPQSGTFNIADDRAYSARELLEFERSQGRCRIVLPLPYYPCLLGAFGWELALAAVHRKPGMLSCDNVRKLVRSSTWDNTRACRVAESLPWTIESTFLRCDQFD